MFKEVIPMNFLKNIFNRDRLPAGAGILIGVVFGSFIWAIVLLLPYWIMSLLWSK